MKLTGLQIALSSAAALLVTCIVVGGYLVYKKRKKGAKIEQLSINTVLSWIDEVTQGIIHEDGVDYQVKVLPNSSTNELLKESKEGAYAAVLVKTNGNESSVLKTRVFYANSVDDSLQALLDDNVVIIPINL